MSITYIFLSLPVKTFVTLKEKEEYQFQCRIRFCKTTDFVCIVHSLTHTPVRAPPSDQGVHILRVPSGVAVLFILLYLNARSVVSLTSCTFPDKWGSLRVWEHRELIRGLRSVLLLLLRYALVNTHRLPASKRLLKHLHQYTIIPEIMNFALNAW